jgi:hypothetical protein
MPIDQIKSSENVGPAQSAASSGDIWDARIAPFCEKYFVVLALLLIAIACARIMSTYTALSITPDEPTHFGCGLEYVANHVYKFETQHPPLSRAMQALGPYLAGVRPAGRTNPHDDALDAIAKVGHFDRIVFLMRLGNLPFFILACYVVCIWGRTFGAPVGILALGLFTSLPTALADAGLATTDMALGATVGAAFLAAIFWARKPTLPRAILLGLCGALACLSKFTALGYLPAAGVLALLCYLVVCWPGIRELLSLAWKRALTAPIVVAVTALLIWAAYWFSIGPGLLRRGFHEHLLAPEFFDGIHVATNHSHDGHGAFLLGHFSWTGWWYYFPVVLSLKTPIAFAILLALGLFVCFKMRARITYLLPIAFCLGILLPAMNSHVDIGIRHIEPIYMGFSIIAALGLKQLLQWTRTGLASALTAGALVAWMLISVGVRHPDYLAYVNAFAGQAPEKMIVDSNYDWGQDLRTLAKDLNKRGVQEISMAVLEGVDRPELYKAWYGLPKTKPIDVCVPSPGLNVVGPTIEKSLSYWSNAPRYYRGDHTPWYELVPPDERVGALLLFNIPPDSKLTCK